MTAPSLQLSIDVEDEGDGHVAIMVMATGTSGEEIPEGGWQAARDRYVAARRQAAGLLARLAVALAPAAAAQAAGHRCPGRIGDLDGPDAAGDWLAAQAERVGESPEVIASGYPTVQPAPGCGISTHGVAEVSDDHDDCPYLVLTVPADWRSWWLARMKAMLKVIVQ